MNTSFMILVRNLTFYLSFILVGILATQKNSLVENNELKIGSVIKLEEYAANVLSKDPPK